MSGFMGATDQCRLALVLLLFTTLIHVVAFGSPYWTTRAQDAYTDAYGNVIMKKSGGHAGLWTACTEGECYERYNLWAPGWVHWCQAFMTTSLVLLVAAIMLLFLYMWHRDFDRDTRLVSVGFAACCIAALLTSLTVMIWPAGQNLQSGEYLNWPYALACLSAILTIIIANLLWKELRKPPFEHSKLAATI